MTSRGIAIAHLIFLLMFVTGVASAQQVRYGRDIRPILSAKCFACHGPDEGSREGELRLDRAEDALADRDGVPAITPRDLSESEVWRRIKSSDDDERMPPPDAKKQLSKEEIQLIQRWISDGAKYEKHWSFEAPQEYPRVPIDDERWAGNPIDAFVARQLKQQGLRHSPEANRYTLVRRLYLDLIGLPPTPAEANAFVEDPSPTAYLQLVDRLLASPHYGERWARPWLDLARYSDTNGYEKDQPRTMWPYRDWVIDAINRDLPFDQFTIEQIAGDMLPNATPDQIVATGFHRNTMINEEGGIDPMEFRYYAQVDRVATTGAVWLGLTVGCAQCHNHKYDPLTQREFYQLMSYYDQADDAEFSLPLPDKVGERRRIRKQIAELEMSLADRFPLPKAEQSEQPEAGRRADYLKRKFGEWIEEQSQASHRWTVLKPAEMKSNLPLLNKLKDGSILAQGDQTKADTFTITTTYGSDRLTAIRLEALPHPSLPDSGPGRSRIAAGVEQRGRFLLNDFSLSIDGAEIELEGASETYAKGDQTATKALDDDPLTGWDSNGSQGRWIAAVFPLKTPLLAPDGAELSIRLHTEAFYPSGLGRFRLSATSDELPIKVSPHPARIEALLHAGRENWSEPQGEIVLQHFLRVTPELKAERDRIDKLRSSLPKLPAALVMQQRRPVHHRTTHIHHRGEFLQTRAAVEPGVLGFLHKPQGGDRLALARWLVSRDNPLSARVVVNRDWAALFGKGLVSTLDDFGVQGESPSHPDLLDWLAVELVNNGWSRKRLHRLMVTSATYRQSSRVSDEAKQRDPENRLLSHGPRFRMEAELIRDVVLSASGLLTETIRGASVFPPQSAAVTADSYGRLNWETSKGADRYRRGLYTFSKRTAPYAMFTTFDAPSGEVCIARRGRSNTPLQALTMLNNPVFVEAAQSLGAETAAHAGTDAERLIYLFQRCLVRRPDDMEQQTLLDFYRRQRERLAKDEAAAQTIAGRKSDPKENQAVVEQAAWSLTARALLNLHELIVKD